MILMGVRQVADCQTWPAPFKDIVDLRTRFQHHVERRLRRPAHPVKPASERTAFNRFSPACAPSASPTSWLSELGVQTIVEKP